MSGSTVRTPDIVQDELKRLHDISGLSWRKIAALDNYNKIGIPAGTLCTFAKTGYMPPKWRYKFGWITIVKVETCPTCGEAPEYCGHCYEVKPKRNGKPKRKKPQPFRPCLPKVTDEQRAKILAMTPEERLRRLLDG